MCNDLLYKYLLQTSDLECNIPILTPLALKLYIMKISLFNHGEELEEKTQPWIQRFMYRQLKSMLVVIMLAMHGKN